MKIKKKKNPKIEKIIKKLVEIEEDHKDRDEALNKIKAWQKKIQARTATVESVIPLSHLELLQIEADLTRLFNKPIIPKNKINKNLLGGLKITVDQKIIDTSLQGQLLILKNKFLNLINAN